MTENLSVDAIGLAASARQFDELADELCQSHLELSFRLRQEGECWGADEPGSAFASGYSGAARTAVERAQLAALAIQNVAERLRDNARLYASTERNTGEQISRIRDEVDGSF